MHSRTPTELKAELTAERAGAPFLMVGFRGRGRCPRRAG